MRLCNWLTRDLLMYKLVYCYWEIQSGTLNEFIRKNGNPWELTLGEVPTAR